jgi:hypothetical protein
MRKRCETAFIALSISNTDMRHLSMGILSEKCVVRRFRFIAVSISNTNKRHLSTGILSEKCVVGRFRRCANNTQCICTNLDSTAYYTPTLYDIAYCS